MGLPAPVAECSDPDESTSQNSAEFVQVIPDTVGDEDLVESLEDKAKKALACPCVAELRDGPCGVEFSTAFVCFIKSQEHEKGSDCVTAFMNMQNCMLANSREFVIDAAPKSSQDDEDSGSNAAEVVAETEVHPPRVPDGVIKPPLSK